MLAGRLLDGHYLGHILLLQIVKIWSKKSETLKQFELLILKIEGFFSAIIFDSCLAKVHACHFSYVKVLNCMNKKQAGDNKKDI